MREIVSGHKSQDWNSVKNFSDKTPPLTVAFFLLTALNSTDNITLNDAQTMLTFFFGPEVLILKDNILNDTEQCFEIGLHCTVSDHPSLVDGEQISYQAYVETDFDIRTSSHNITLNVCPSW